MPFRTYHAFVQRSAWLSTQRAHTPSQRCRRGSACACASCQHQADPLQLVRLHKRPFALPPENHLNVHIHIPKQNPNHARAGCQTTEIIEAQYVCTSAGSGYSFPCLRESLGDHQRSRSPTEAHRGNFSSKLQLLTDASPNFGLRRYSYCMFSLAINCLNRCACGLHTAWTARMLFFIIVPRRYP